MKRVKAGSTYTFVPVPIDRSNPPHGVSQGFLKAGDKVKVVNLRGCPPANTMGHAHINKGDRFAGLVCVNSLLNSKELQELKDELAKDEPELLLSKEGIDELKAILL